MKEAGGLDRHKSGDGPSSEKLYLSNLAVLFAGFIFGLAAAYAFNSMGINPSGSLEEARRLGIASATTLRGYSKTKDVLTYVSVFGFPVLFSCVFWLLWANTGRRAGLARILEEKESGGQDVFGAHGEHRWFWRLALPAMIAIYFFYFKLIIFYHSPINNWQFTNWRFQGEEGVVLAWAQQILKGRVYGRDFLSPYGPMLLYPVAWLMKLTGPSVIMPRVYTFFLDFAAYAITIVFLHRTVKSRAVFIFASLMTFVILFSFDPFSVNRTFLRFTLGLLPILLAYIYIESGKKIFPFLAGLVAGQSLLFSQEAGICSVLAVAAAFALSFIKDRRAGGSGRGSLAAAGWFALFTVVSVAPMLVYFSANGGLGTFFSAITLFPRLFAIGFGDIPFTDFANFVRHPFSGGLLAFWAILIYALTAVCLLPFLVLGFNKRHILMASVLAFGALLYRSALGRSDFLHVLNAAHPAFLLAFLFMDDVVCRISWDAPGYRKAAGGVMLAGLLASMGLLMSRPWFVSMAEESAKSVFNDSRFSVGGGYTLTGIERAGDSRWDRGLAESIAEVQEFLQQNLKPGDQVYFFPNDAAFYFLFNLDCPVKHVIAFNAATSAQRAELISDLEKNRPEFLVYDKTTYRVDKIPETVYAPEVVQYLNSKYRPVAETKDFIFARRIAP
ncbi:MAG: hypothetical protein M0018_10105 [Nitrospiraceae bacterium]|nr:hypothetical protein [Nitrospiraceae bacterium]